MIIDGHKLESVIDTYVNGFRAERNRAILKLHYIEGHTYEEVAEIMGMSAVHVGRIIRNFGETVINLAKK